MNRVKSKRLRLKQGFTLMEVLVSSFLMALVMGMLFTILIGTMDAWEGGTTRLQTNSDARLVLDMITRDLQSMVVRQTTSDQHWLSSQPVTVDGISGVDSTWLTFFAPSIDRTPGQEGDIVALSYRCAFQDPVSTTDLFKVFGIYKYMASTQDTFTNALGLTDTATFWSTVNPIERAGLLAPNVVRLEVAWWVKGLTPGNLTRLGPEYKVMLNNSLWIDDGNGGAFTPVPGATLEAADVTLTILSEEGMQQAEAFDESGNLNASKVEELIETFGRVHTARVSISY
jgi:prepilin-type N-terminal cleavage/methylation domain-containing protein